MTTTVAEVKQKTEGKHDCGHTRFRTATRVTRMENDKIKGQIDGYMLEIAVKCLECNKVFRFKNLPYGVNMNGATMSVDGLEARLAIEPNDPKISRPQLILQ